MSFFDDEPIDVKPKPWMSECNFVLVKEAMLPNLIDRCIAARKYSLDLETTGLNRNVINGKTVDDIVGVCLSYDGITGYYLPIRHRGYQHNIPWEVAHVEMTRLCASDAIALFHNASFDQEFLQFNGLAPIGDWGNKDRFEDTLILAYLFDSKGKQGLKDLSHQHLNREMIELKELFPPKAKKDFSALDPEHMPTLWYAASDAICTYNLYMKLKPAVVDPPMHSQKVVYAIEKACVDATRSMERNLVCVDIPKVRELISVANRELLETLDTLYGLINTQLGRDTRPNYLRIVMGVPVNGQLFQPFDPDGTEKFDDYLEKAEKIAKAHTRHVPGVVTKHVPSLLNPNEKEMVDFPEIYDIFSSTQLGHLLRELGAPVTLSDKGNIQTGAKELDELLDKVDDSFSALKTIGKLRSVIKVHSTYLYPFLEDSFPLVCEDGETRYFVRAGFKQTGTDTGRFSASTGQKENGSTRVTFHGVPARAKTGGSSTLGRMRECVVPRKRNSLMVSCDFSGVELRIAAAFSNEPKWVAEFFRCSKCGYEFERPQPGVTPDWIDAFCVKCGSDKVGDIHTLTALSLFGDHAYHNDPKLWKEQRGTGKCMTGPTWVRTRHGIRTLESLNPGTPDGEFKGMTETVATEAGWEQTSHYYNGGVKPVFRVVLESGLYFEGTAVHPIRVSNGSRVDWRKIGDIVPGDRVVSGKTPPLPWGDYVFESRSYRRGLEWCYDTQKNSIRYAVPEKIREMFPGIYASDNPSDRLVFAPENPSCAVPGDFADDNEMMNFFLGVIDSAANIREDGRILLMHGDLDTLNILRKLASACGFRTGYRPEMHHGIERHIAEIKQLDLQGAFRKAVLATSQAQKKGFRNRGAVEKVLTDVVIAVIPMGQQQVWDLHVPGSHSFWADGIMAHNTTNFALAYGGGANALVRPGVTLQEAERQKQKFDDAYVVLREWWERTKSFARQHGYVLTAFGRRYPLPDIQLPKYDKATGMSNGRLIAAAGRNATNTPIQGTSADITKIGMVYVNRLIREKGWQNKVLMLMTIHDELVFEIDLDILEEACDEITKAMTRNPMVLSLKWPIPLTSDTEMGKDWTVKYNLIAMRKGEKDWPEWLAPYFKQKKLKYWTSPSQGHEIREFHLGDLKDALEEKASEVVEKTPEIISVVAVEVKPKPVSIPVDESELPSTGDRYLLISGNEVIIRIPRMDLGFLNDLAYCIDKADGTGKSIVKFVMDNGEDVTTEFIRYFKRSLRVDVEVLRAVMKTRDFV